MQDTRTMKFEINDRFFALLLALLIVVDSYITIKIGTELNPIITWCMSKFDLTLSEAMFWRAIWCLPFIYIIYKYGKAKLTIGLYFLLYGLLVFIQFFHYL